MASSSWMDRQGYKNAARYRARMQFVLAGIPLDGARVLDVGCGRGAFSLWAATHGARYVLAIEPEAAGSRSGTLAALECTADELALTNIVARPYRLEDVQPSIHDPFDVVVLYNVINHLDEDAVERLPSDQQARARYLERLVQLRSLTASGGRVVVADCARSNLWSRLGLRSPFAPTIEWRKHLDPHDWIALFDAAGFTRPDLRWSYLRYPSFAVLTGNRLVQYTTASHFVLHFTNP